MCTPTTAVPELSPVSQRLEKQPSRSRRMVRWASKAALRLTAQKSASQRRESWYNQSDYKSFKKDCKRTIVKAGAENDTNSTGGDEELCVRGLEVLGADQECASLRRERRKKARDAIVGECSPENSSAFETYSAISEKSQKDAHERALKMSEENQREGMGQRSLAALQSAGESMRKLWKRSGSFGRLHKKTRESHRSLVESKSH